MSDLLITAVKPMKRPKWLAKCSRPVQLLVEERIVDAGFEDDPDQWVADLLTTARNSPQGHILRLGKLNRNGKRLLGDEALVGADLFNAETRGGSGE